MTGQRGDGRKFFKFSSRLSADDAGDLYGGSARSGKDDSMTEAGAGSAEAGNRTSMVATSVCRPAAID